MLVRRVFGIAMIAAGLLACRAHAQENQQPEFFNVSNQSNAPLWVSMRAHGGVAPNRAWQRELKIDPRQVGQYPLWAPQPFDILIRQEDGTAIYFSGIFLCAHMRNCERTNGVERFYDLPGIRGRILKGANGQRIFEFDLDDPKAVQIFHSEADARNITMPFVLFPGQNDPPEIPPQGPNRNE